MSAQEKVSVNAVSRIEVAVDRVEEINEATPSNQQTQSSLAAKHQPVKHSVIKLLTVEGSVGQYAYTTKFTTIYEVSMNVDL